MTRFLFFGGEELKLRVSGCLKSISNGVNLQIKQWSRLGASNLHPSQDFPPRILGRLHPSSSIHYIIMYYMLFCVGNHSARYLVRTIQWDIAYVFYDVHPESSETLLVFFRGKFRIFWTAPRSFLTSPWCRFDGLNLSTTERPNMEGRCSVSALGNCHGMGWGTTFGSR